MIGAMHASLYHVTAVSSLQEQQHQQEKLTSAANNERNTTNGTCNEI